MREAPAPSSGWVTGLQRYSLHDGPGIRTTVFLQGCPLRCLWCCNPETQEQGPMIIHWLARCLSCNACMAACPHDAIRVGKEGARLVDDNKCDGCGQCVAECYSGALEQVGRIMSAEEVLAEVVQDRAFYEESGGGMTLSGGEPTAQPDFALALLSGAKALGFHTAIESCGDAPWPVWERLLPWLDLVLFDLKELDPEKHVRLTGVSNERILENLARLVRSQVPVILRRPFIPGCNDDEASLHALAHFVHGLGPIRTVHLLPYHRFGREKYRRLGRDYPMGEHSSLETEELSWARELLRSYGLEVRIGG